MEGIVNKMTAILQKLRALSREMCPTCEACTLRDIGGCTSHRRIREITMLADSARAELLESQHPKNSSNCKRMYGYELEDLARVATLMQQCDVAPEDIKRLSNNVAQLYGVVMRGIKQDFKIARDSILMQCRYPGIGEVLREMEGKHGKS